MNLRTAAHLFDGLSNHIDAEPTTIRLISDRVLIRDLEDQEKTQVGSILIPESAQEKTAPGKDGRLRMGIVVATGPGDRCSEHGLDAQGQVRLRRLTKPCEKCETGRFFDIKAYEYVACPACGGTARETITVPPQCQVGDKVLYDLRRHETMVIGGVLHSLVHAEQAVWAVLEEGIPTTADQLAEAQRECPIDARITGTQTIEWADVEELLTYEERK